MSLIKQEVLQERWIEIPDEVQSIYRQWRPTPLYRARQLEQTLDTPAKIYYKYVGDTAHLTPLMKMHTLGSTFVPEGIHAGGLRYDGMAPLMSHVVALGLAQARSEY
jgi:predicted alternative tryptophan synthase beta-subunit